VNKPGSERFHYYYDHDHCQFPEAAACGDPP